ncbi:MAG: hypothetical protein U0K23_07110 [Selenomonadaceae bacterium]|nr:hypothetical protein [Selenomonadaceae bacterium]
MAEATDFLPGGGMVNIGNAEEPWKEIHAERIYGDIDGKTAEAEKAAGYSIVDGIPCFTYNK